MLIESLKILSVLLYIRGYLHDDLQAISSWAREYGIGIRVCHNLLPVLQHLLSVVIVIKVKTYESAMLNDGGVGSLLERTTETYCREFFLKFLAGLLALFSTDRLD